VGCYIDRLTAPDAQHPHSAAPEQFKISFGEFLKKFQSPAKAGGNGSSSGANVYQEYWEAPSKYWSNRVKPISEEEIDAVLVILISKIHGDLVLIDPSQSGGATLH
jgi:small subunit ribosomal protein YMR-31